MDDSLRTAMLQMVNLSAQQLNALNQLNNTVQMNSQGSAITPNPSVLTSYTNYAAPYAGPPNPFSPSPNAQAQFNNYASQIAPNGLGDAIKQYINTPTGQISPEQRQMMGANFGATLTNTGIAGAGAVGSGIASAAGLMLTPGLALPLAMGTAAGALSGAVTSVALDQAQQAQSYNKYLLQNSYKFINPLESTNTRGLGGFDQSQRWEAASFMRNFDVKSNITDKQSMELLQSFSEGDLMKSASDLKTFEKKFSQLTDYIKSASVTLQTTFKQTADLMGDMEKRGILSQNFDYFSSLARGTGSFTGQSGLESMSSMMNLTGSMITPGSTANVQVAAKNAAYYNKYTYDIFERGKSAMEKGVQGTDADLYNYISSAGGPDQAQQRAISAANNAWGQQGGFLTALYVKYGMDNKGNFSDEKFRNNISSLDWQTLSSGAGDTLQGLANAGTLDWWMKKAQSKFQENPLGMMYSAFANAQPGQTAAQNIARYGGLGYNDALFTAALGQEDTAANRAVIDSSAKRQQMIATANANAYGIKDSIRNIGAGIGNTIGNIIAPGQQGMAGAAQYFTDIFQGGAITLNTLSDASYSSQSRLRSFDDIEKTTRDAALPGSTVSNLLKGNFSSSVDWGAAESVSDVRKQIKQKMNGMSSSDPKYKQYQDLMTQYDSVVKNAQGMQEAGTLLSAGMSGKDRWWWNTAYNNKDWNNMSAGAIEAQESKMVDYTKEQIRELGGDKTRVDKFLDKTQLAGLTGKSYEDLEKKLMGANNNEKLTKLVEEIMTDLNKKSNDPTKQNSGVPGAADASMNANQVIIYAGGVTDNSKAGGRGLTSPETGYGISTVGTLSTGYQRKVY